MAIGELPLFGHRDRNAAEPAGVEFDRSDRECVADKDLRGTFDLRVLLGVDDERLFAGEKLAHVRGAEREAREPAFVELGIAPDRTRDEILPGRALQPDRGAP